MAIDWKIAKKITKLLNKLYTLDPAAVSSLVETRVPCNTALSEHPSVQVVPFNASASMVGLLGILNGLCGTLPDGSGPLMARYTRSGDFDIITGFALAKKPPAHQKSKKPAGE